MPDHAPMFSGIDVLRINARSLLPRRKGVLLLCYTSTAEYHVPGMVQSEGYWYAGISVAREIKPLPGILELQSRIGDQPQKLMLKL